MLLFSVLCCHMRGRQRKGRKRGRKSKRSNQETEEEIMSDQRKKETRKDREDVLSHADMGRNTEYTETLGATAFYRILAKDADFLGHPFVCRLKVLTPQASLVRSQGVWSLWGQTSCPGPTSQTCYLWEQYVLLLPDLPVFRAKPEMWTLSLYKTTLWAKQNISLGTVSARVDHLNYGQNKATPPSRRWLDAQFSQPRGGNACRHGWPHHRCILAGGLVASMQGRTFWISLAVSLLESGTALRTLVIMSLPVGS